MSLKRRRSGAIVWPKISDEAAGSIVPMVFMGRSFLKCGAGFLHEKRKCGVFMAGKTGRRPYLSIKLPSGTVSPAPHPQMFGEAASMKLVVTIPALNEEKTIAQVIAGVPRNIPGVDEVE